MKISFAPGLFFFVFIFFHLPTLGGGCLFFSKAMAPRSPRSKSYWIQLRACPTNRAMHPGSVQNTRANKLFTYTTGYVLTERRSGFPFYIIYLFILFIFLVRSTTSFYITNFNLSYYFVKCIIFFLPHFVFILQEVVPDPNKDKWSEKELVDLAKAIAKYPGGSFSRSACQPNPVFLMVHPPLFF